MFKMFWFSAALFVLSSSCFRGSTGFQSALTAPLPQPQLRQGGIHCCHQSKFQRQILDGDKSKTSTALEAAPSPLIALASSPVGAMGVLATIILIHEAGHYLAARSFGIEVEEFSIGVGPKLIGFEALGNDFNLRLIPLGGYVRFPENYNATEVQQLQKQAFEEAVAKKNQEANPTLGYRIANAITFGALQRKDRKLEDERTEKRLEEYESLPWWGKLQAIQKKQKEEESLEVEDVEIPYDDNPNLLQNRPWPQRAVVICAGVFFNLLLSFSIYFGQVGGPGLPSPVFDQGVRVKTIPQVNAPAVGRLEPGDVITSVNGYSLISSSSARPTMLEANQRVSELIAAIRDTPDGGKVELSVVRAKGDFMETVTITPKRPNKIGEDSLGPQSIGVMLTPNVKNEKLMTKNPLEAARMAFQYTYSLTSETANGLASFLKQAILSNGGNGGSGASVSGPIGLIRTGSEVVATKDLQTVLLFAAAISINLGVINAFPLPALDGGQLIFVLAEAITRRKIDQRVQEGITGFAVLILLGVTVGTTISDISSIFVGR